MKYIRTKDRIYKVVIDVWGHEQIIDKNGNVLSFVIDKQKQADTIEELCDFAYALWKDGAFETYDLSYDTITLEDLYRNFSNGSIKEVYYGIKTDKGLIYVAKMNDKGELELI